MFFLLFPFLYKIFFSLSLGILFIAARQLPRHLHTLACEKLDILDAAHELNDLKIPPGNRLAKLKGNLRNKHSIRINDQWRIVFAWRDGHIEDVEIIDYH